MEPVAKKAKTEHTCNVCNTMFASRHGLHRHKSTFHGNKEFRCEVCSAAFNRKDNLKRHRKSHTNQVGGALPNERGTEENSQPCEEALNGTMQKYKIRGGGMEMFDPMMFLRVKYDQIKKVLKEAVIKRGALKWYMSMKVKMTRKVGDRTETVEPHFRGKCQTALKVEDIENGIRNSVQKAYSSFIEYQRQGSNWTVDKVVEVVLHMARYRPLRGSSYIPLPIKLRSKHAIINVQNKDNKCFMWSVLAALHPTTKNAERPSKYRDYVNELDFSDISFPVKIADIAKFERRNNIGICLFAYEKGDVYPIHISSQRYERQVNLLITSDKRKSHYCWIKNLNRLLSDQHKDRHIYHYCPYCLHGFTKDKNLKEHLPYCQTHGPQKIQMPKEEDKWLQFNDVRKQLKVPYIIYADFECLQVPIHEKQGDKSIKTTRHEPSGFAYKVVGLTPEASKDVVVYRGLDAADKFVSCMVKEQEEIEKRFRHIEPLVMLGRDWQKFKMATHCHICKEELGSDRVRDHCHVTGKFRGAAHKSCNINYKFTGRIPVVFHNLRGYDSHIIMQAIGKVDKEIKCIANNMEKYISFSMGCMDFIDSFQFMNSSLETLIDNLAKDKNGDFVEDRKDKFQYMAQHFGEDKLDLLLRKQVFPYEYFDSENKFKETRLPPIEAFYSTLSDEGITQEEYEHAQKVWEAFNIENLGQYIELYVVSDVLSLTSVFQNFRDICLDYYGLDAAHFFTSPGLAWQAALKMTGVQLELLTDIDMHLFIEKGLRGGISMISHRFAKSNNRYVPDYDPNVPDSHIIYLDANNLYGWAMSQYLPTHDFRWMKQEEIEQFNVAEVSDEASEGYILEVDLEYPKELHELHNDYPLAPEEIRVTEDMLSPYTKELIKELNLTGTLVEKLIPNLNSKKKYVIHYRNLKQYLSLGMKLTKIHRVMVFEQSAWLKPYIDFNTEKRKMARNSFEKDFFKLMNNAVFGKTMENLRKRVDVKLVNSQKKARKLICKPSFHAFKIFNTNLVGVHMKKQKLYLNRPIYVGFSILDISKTLMYDFHYNYVKEKYGPNATLLFTDTDSLAYSIQQTEDIYEDMKADLHLFDTSEYETRHPLYSEKNRKIIGKMKDETNGNAIHEFVGLKSKMYSLYYEKVNGDESKVLVEKKTAKGVKKSVIEMKTRHEHYKQCLFNKSVHLSNMTQIRHFNHQLYNVSMTKLGLTPYDDKRFILSDGVSSLAYGHYKIPQYVA